MHPQIASSILGCLMLAAVGLTYLNIVFFK